MIRKLLHYLRFFKSLLRNHSFPKAIYMVFESMFYLCASGGLTLRDNERTFAKFKGKHHGERCFIIGNGPSLNKIDLTKLQEETTFGVNAIYLNHKKMKFHPTYYVVEDMFVAEDRKEEINNYKESIKFFGNYLNYCLKKDEKTIFTNVIFDYSNYRDFPNFSRSALKSLYVGGTVSYLCMQLAYYMGFKEVYLVGFDHSYKIPDSVIKKGLDITSTENDVNHFSAEYFGKGKRWHDPLVERMEISYHRANKEFVKNGGQIFNATCGGKLEVFERVEYSTLF